jgi:hypothetical protein
MNDDDFVRAVRWVCVTMLGVVAMILAAAAICLPPDNPPPTVRFDLVAPK